MDVERGVTAQQIVNTIQSEVELGLSRTVSSSQPVFALWLCSSELEIQLRPNHKPLELAAKWSRLVETYGTQRYRDSGDEEPMIYYRRNVFLSRREEELIKEPKILELLFAEAKKNILEGDFYHFYIANERVLLE